jgi:hypothetical protein
MSPFANSRGDDADGRPEAAYLYSAACLICGTVVVLEAENIEVQRDYATVPCTACSALVPIPLADALRAIEAQSRRGRQAIFGARHRR